jgi:serine/threonine protein kinase/tetratricopeptide (TPR) repeat protein
MKCPKCHSENSESKQFCGDCGTPLPSSKVIRPEVTETIQTPIKELTTGSTFAGRYHVIEELGHGGMGRVYKVQDTDIKEKVALKLLRPEITLDKDTVERFSNELKLARRISHRNVCRMFDLGRAEGTTFITMEFVPGEDLKSFIHRSKHLSTGTAISIAKQVCEGLEEAHRLGVVHRDLKPGNIMIDKDGDAKIMDFGIARSLSGRGITGAGVLIGTPEYMSPEQVEGKDIDQRSDIYSLGVILYEMVTGRLPFAGDTPLSVAHKQKYEAPEDPKKLNAQLPDDLARVILKCLAKDRDKRFQSAAELGTELGRIEQGLPTTDRVVPVRKTLTSREITVKFTLRKLAVPVSIIVAVAAVAVIVWRILPQKRTALPAGGKPVLAVMYFKNSTGNKAFDVWRDGLSTALISGLSQSKYISVLPANDVYGILKRLNLLDAANYTTEDLKKAAAAGKANHVVSGSLSKAGDAFRIDYSLQDLSREKTLGSGSVTGTGENSILTSLLNELTRKIKEDLNFTGQEIAADIDKGIGKITTSSAEAYKFYIEGVRFHQNGQYRESIALMEKALALDPEFAMAYRSMAILYANMGFRARFREYMEKALKYADRLGDYEKYLIQGQYAASLGKTVEFIEALKKGHDLYPDDNTFSISLGNAYYSIEEFAKGAEVLEISRKNRSSNFKTYLNLAASYAGLNDYNRAVDVLNDSIRNAGDLAIAHLNLADCYAEWGKLDLALTEADKAFSLDPNDKNSILAKGDILYYKNDLAAAEKEYRPLLEAAEPEIKWLAMLGFAYLQLTRGQFHKAIEQYEQAITLAEKSGEKSWAVRVRHSLSYLFTFLKDYQKALAYNNEVLKYAAENEDLECKRNGLCMRTFILAEMRSFPEALKTAEELKILYEGDLNKKLIRNYYAVMSKIELERNDYTKAIRYGEDSLALFPYGELTKPANIYDLLGQAHYRKGDLEKARDVYEKITALTTGRLAFGDIYARSFYWLGKIYERLGNKTKALENYRKFLSLWKDADPGLPELENARKTLAGLKVPEIP